MPNESTALTALLAEHVVASRWQDMPAHVLREAKRSLFNFFGCALGGCTDIAIEHALRALAGFSGPREATLIGRAERLDALNAAYFNAMSANVFDFDDTHLRTVIHPTAPVAPALLALAERQCVSGAKLLHALALGIDIACRIGNAISPGHYNRGWHITGTCGVFGAAAGAGKLLGLTKEQMLWALGNAATQASGLVESLGVMAKSLNLGNAARGGLIAALLAREGFTGADHAVEGRHGFLQVMGDKPNFVAVTDGLGQYTELLANTYKPYPCGVVLHPVIDACLELRANQGVRATDVEAVLVKGNPLLRVRADRKGVTTGREAKVSLHHSVAVAFLFGKAGVKEYVDELVNDPTVRALGSRVTMEDDAAMPVESATVTVKNKAGRSHTAHVAHARGSLGRPLTDAELEAKFRDLAEIGAPEVDAARAMEAVWAMARAEDVGSVLRLTRV